MKKTITYLICAMALTVALAGCGDDGVKVTPKPTPTNAITGTATPMPTNTPTNTTTPTVEPTTTHTPGTSMTPNP